MKRRLTSMVVPGQPVSPLPPARRINGLRHPGVILSEDFMIPRGLDATTLAEAMGADPFLIHAFLAATCSVTAYGLAAKLERYFGIDAEWWLERQRRWDREITGEDVIGSLSGIVPFKTTH